LACLSKIIANNRNSQPVTNRNVESDPMRRTLTSVER
jgi:hypothetical protein